MAHQITLIPGDGIGPEVAEATVRVVAASGVEVEWDRVHLFPRTSAMVALLRDANATHFAVEVSTSEGFAKPDVLVYWYSGPQPSPRDIPDDSVLLGACNTRLPLPASAQAGRLLLFSLADHEILDTSQLFTVRKP